jgi:rhamnosyltransferase
MATYDGAKWIGEQTLSILNQRLVEVRIAVRDDGSSDSTASDVARLAAKDPRITLSIADKPSGSAAQNFFALIRTHDAAEFDYVALSDQDDIWDEDKLHRSSQALKRSSGCAASSSVIAVWPNGRSGLLIQNPSQTKTDFLFEGAGQGCTFLLTSAFYSQLRSFVIEHPSLTSDIHYHDWSIYALARAWRLVWTFVPDTTLRYRQHTANDTGARSSIGGAAMRFRRIRNGWYREQLMGIARVCRAAAPSDPMIATWDGVLHSKPSWRRRIKIVRTCLTGGRRRFSDNIVLIVSALLGAI